MTIAFLRAALPAAALSLYLCVPAAAADQAATTPLLRIESGSHTAPIRALSTDATGRYAVTASEDKTARVWDLSSSRLLQVLRPPIGNDSEGKLYAAAMSPDGNLIATGGWSKDNDVYIFQRTSGQLIHRVTGLPNVITHLAFSPDGRALVVNLWGKNGIRLYASEDGWQSSREAAVDSDYGGESYGADFSRDGKRLVTTSFDGLVRLYDVAGGRLRLQKSARVEGGGRPFAAVMSPDRARIAVSFSDSNAVSVIDAETLSLAYSPSVDGIDNGNLSALAWSADGRQLFAAGSWKRADAQHGLRRWEDGGKRAYTDSTLAGNTVVALRALGEGRLVYAATDPSWGIVSASNERLSASAAGLADFRGNRTAFRLARDATAVSFGYVFGQSETGAFDLVKMEWSSTAPEWLAPRAGTKDMMLEQWFESTQPSLNQRRLRLDADEVSLSAAINPAGTHLALGTSFHVRYFNREGVEQWRVIAPGTTWQVNLSQDGRWLVAGFSDGTIRWYRVRDGAEQLAFFPHADRKRWVMWTPQGYYTASPGGEDLIGWHINRGNVRAADFFPGSRFRASFFRPDVIAQVLVKADGEAALQAANNAAGRKLETARIESRLPPVVTVLSPSDGGSVSSQEVKISVAVRAPADAQATSLRVRVNGRVVDIPAGQNLPRPTGTGSGEVQHELRVPLPAQDAEVMIFAENQNGFSTPAVLRLRWTGVEPVSTPAASAPAPPQALLPSGAVDTRPTLYVLAVGVSKYANPALKLDYAAKDASDFAAAFKPQQDGLYRKVVIKLLTDESARRDDVLDGLEWIRRELTSRDVGMVFFAGHGVNDSDGVYYYLPQDVDIDKLKRTGVIFTEIRNTLASLPGKALFFVDTCHSGNVLGTGRRGARNDLTAVVNELSSAENGVIVFAASTGRQYAQESTEWRNGVFTKALLEGVGGKADHARSGRVTHKMLDLYTSERVKTLTKGSQSPVTIVPQGVPDFPVAITR
jgi:WD40 repeat protein